MMKKKILFMLLLSLTCVGAVADEAYALVVTMKSGQGVYGYLVKDKPEVTCGGTEFWVKTVSENLEVTRSRVQKYAYDKVFTLNDTLTGQTVATGDYAAALIVRTLTPGAWNTLCLPFALSASQVTELFGAGTQLREYTGCDVANKTFRFKAVSSVEAGVAYLVKPTQAQTTYKKQLFVPSVKVTAATPKTSISTGGYGFQGVYQPYKLNGDGSNLFLITGGRLVTPAVGKETMKGMRAYFIMPTTANAKLFRVDLGDEEPTGIAAIDAQEEQDTKVYSLSGQHLGEDLQGLPKGIYIVNGRKIAVK